MTLESASITEMAVALGLDWVVIDAEHGHLDWKEILEHLRAWDSGRLYHYGLRHSPRT